MKQNEALREWNLNKEIVSAMEALKDDFRIDLIISRGEESETVTIYREAEAGETLQDVVREVYEAFDC